jgi:hypothetical protein
MSNYTILGLENHQILLGFDGKKVNFPLPMVDGLYPQGAELDALLTQYVSNAQLAAAQSAAVALNDATIRSLVVTPLAPTLTTAEVAQSVRTDRNRLMVLTDWTVLPNSPFTTAETTAWATYRQGLRDITTQSGFPSTVVWPVPPFPVTTPNGVVRTSTDGSPIPIIR